MLEDGESNSLSDLYTSKFSAGLSQKHLGYNPLLEHASKDNPKKKNNKCLCINK